MVAALTINQVLEEGHGIEWKINRFTTKPNQTPKNNQKPKKSLSTPLHYDTK